MAEYDFQPLIKYLSSRGVELTDEMQHKFTLYYEMLTEKNKVMNLTAIIEWEDVIRKHFIDSLSLLEILDASEIEGRLLDLGTGAGFPGIPLKIVFPELQVVLADSLNKRILFLQDVIRALELSDVEALHGRAEDLGRREGYRESFDLVVSRAVSNLSVLSEYCLPFVKIGGSFIPYKTEALPEEMRMAFDGITLLGGRISEERYFSLPDTDMKRGLLLVKKDHATPKKYPRKAGLPAKDPL
ncbi:MAG: 16S rRNA (guanine(527)-N(7))-methyltransferase RsmG [Lachnospiraceae bacterium]|nr:16S rRNA (guanine(527)-N(7))-methyltransferase RsmG [Lachnospiraceae bacterium]